MEYTLNGNEKLYEIVKDVNANQICSLYLIDYANFAETLKLVLYNDSVPNEDPNVSINVVSIESYDLNIYLNSLDNYYGEPAIVYMHILLNSIFAKAITHINNNSFRYSRSHHLSNLLEVYFHFVYSDIVCPNSKTYNTFEFGGGKIAEYVYLIIAMIAYNYYLSTGKHIVISEDYINTFAYLVSGKDDGSSEDIEINILRNLLNIVVAQATNNDEYENIYNPLELIITEPDPVYDITHLTQEDNIESTIVLIFNELIDLIRYNTLEDRSNWSNLREAIVLLSRLNIEIKLENSSNIPPEHLYAAKIDPYYTFFKCVMENGYMLYGQNNPQLWKDKLPDVVSIIIKFNAKNIYKLSYTLNEYDEYQNVSFKKI